MLRLGAVCVALIGLIGTQALAGAASSPKPSDASDGKTPAPASVVTAMAPKTDAPAAAKTDVSGGVQAVEASAKKTELDALKDEFAELMRKRAGLFQRCDASLRLISSARDTMTEAPIASLPETALKYREAILATEKALDAHPRVLALKEQYEVAQTDKVAVSRIQSEILDAWHKAKQDRSDNLNKMLNEADERAGTARRDLLKQAGVKDAKELSEEDTKKFKAITDRLTNDIFVAKQAYTNGGDEASWKMAREKDGSAKRFDDLNARYKELEQRQADINAEIVRVRDELRKGDPGIAKLDRTAYEASQKHVAAMDAKPEVAAAIKFLEDVDKERAEIDKKARALRKTILAKDPAYKDRLQKQAVAGGYALVGEDFWKEEN